MTRTLVAALALAVATVPAPRPPAGARLITHGPRGQRLVALTFDADLTVPMLEALRAHRVARWYDPAILAELRATRTPSTIFVTGLWAATYPRLTRSLAADPLFELENHSYDHAGWERPCYGLPAAVTAAQKRDELRRGAVVLSETAGVAPTYFRFPGGCTSRHDVRLVDALGERAVQWDVVSGDAYLRDPRSVARHVLDATRPGSIVVMHLVGAPNAPATASALRAIVPGLRARGFRLVTLRRLLRERPARPGAGGTTRPRGARGRRGEASPRRRGPARSARVRARGRARA